MGDCHFHQQRAREALTAAQALREAHPGWALVPLFYSAMHAMHYAFARDVLPSDRQHPEQHVSRRGHSGEIMTWGTLEVVREHYPRGVSQAYSSLFSASLVARYSRPMQGDGARFWGDFDVIAHYIDETDDAQPAAGS